KNDSWTGIRTANTPAVIYSAAAASGAKKEISDGFILEVLSTAVVSATVKCNHAGEIAGRMLQGTMKSPSHFSHHPAAAGTFFTAMLLGLNASLSWFAYGPEWYETNSKSFAQSEAQSVSLFVHHLLNERVDSIATDSSMKGRGHENELLNMVFYLISPGFCSVFSSQVHISEIRTIPEALPFFVTPKAIEENSVLLQQLPHWASCSITQALEFFSPPYKGHPRVMAYAMRVLESYPPERVTFFMPQLVQALRYDEGVGVLHAKYFCSGSLFLSLTSALQTSNDRVSHVHKNLEKMLMWSRVIPFKQYFLSSDRKLLMVSPLRPLTCFEESLTFLTKSHLFPVFSFHYQRRNAELVSEGITYIALELEKISIDGDDLYLPTAPNKIVQGIQLDSGIPLQSAAKVPIMITFNVVDKDGDPNDVRPQACIFKVSLQNLVFLKIMQVVPNTRSRNQMGETTDGGLYEIFQQDYGPVGSPTFEAAREMFMISSAGYAVASLLLQPKDRHNGNLLFDKYALQ
ncbi:hypothetical protein B296_00024686, partial [Ensete ventricosum]